MTAASLASHFALSDVHQAEVERQLHDFRAGFKEALIRPRPPPPNEVEVLAMVITID